MKTKLKPVVPPVACPECSNTRHGVLFSVLGSRLEYFLGHALYRCDKCEALFKTTPHDGVYRKQVEEQVL